MLYLALFVLGIVTLVRGKIEISPRRHVVGTRARCVGIALVLTPGAAIVAALVAAKVLDKSDQLNFLVAGIRALEWALVGVFALVLLRLATPTSPLPERPDFSGIDSKPREVDFSFLQPPADNGKPQGVPTSDNAGREQGSP